MQTMFLQYGRHNVDSNPALYPSINMIWKHNKLYEMDTVNCQGL